MEAWRTKMVVGENVEDEVCGWCMEKKPYSRGHLMSSSIIYKIAIMSCRITKMPLLRL